MKMNHIGLKCSSIFRLDHLFANCRGTNGQKTHSLGYAL
jgi:hypothetical protein